MPRGQEQQSDLLGKFCLKFSLNKIVMGKKIVVPCLDVIMIAVFYFFF